MRAFSKILLVGLVAAAAWAALAWPHLHRVETGRTPEYPDLQPREYSASPAQVAKAVDAAITRLPGWSRVGGGQGPGGTQIQATARMPLVQVPHEVFIWVRPQKGRTVVSVKSETRHQHWDFGQNAPNIRLFLAELDRQVN